MFVGHALLAFALVASLGAVRGWSRDRTFRYAALAAGFAAIPDVDMAYAPIGLVLSDAGTPTSMARTFWATGNLVHRAITHSVVMAVPIAALAALRVYAAGDASRRRGALAVGATMFAGAIGVTAAVSGPLGGAITVLFGLTAVALAEAGRRYTDVTPGTLFALALVGFVSHPFGDLLTGDPPAFLYPLGTTLTEERLVLYSADPTVNLLGAFGIELLTVWLGLGAALWLAGVRPIAPVRASLATGYGASVLLLPAPTLDLSYPFVFSVLAVGAIGVCPRIRLVDVDDGGRVEFPDPVAAVTTGVAAVTVAWLAYTAAYVLFA